MVVQSTDTVKDQEVDVAREGVVCTLAEWCMPSVMCWECGFDSDVGVAKGIS